LALVIAGIYRRIAGGSRRRPRQRTHRVVAFCSSQWARRRNVYGRETETIVVAVGCV
jgi:hypothetical protein